MVFRPELSWEFLSCDEIEAKSVRALRNHIRHVKECSAFYRSLLDGIAPEDIVSLDDIGRLPLTTRNSLVEMSPQFLGVSAAQIVETVLTAGTAGRALPFVLTLSDLDRASFSHALSFHALGMTATDRTQVLLSLDRFSIGGMASYRGSVMAGANTMRLGIGASMSALMQRYLQFFRPTVLIAAPSVLRALAIEMNNSGFDTAKCRVGKLVCTSEAVYTRKYELTGMAKELEALWGAQAFSLYTSTELCAAYGDCCNRSGCHAHPELVYTEIVDDQGKAVPDGEVGELVVTPLGVEGVPLLRYRTGDMTFKIPGGCTCGRNSCRIGPVLGRRSELFTCGQTLVYPRDLTDALDTIEEVKDYLVILESDNRQADTATIHVAAPPSALASISRAIRDATGVHIPALVSNIPTIQSLRGGANKKTPVIDKRTKTVAKSGAGSDGKAGAGDAIRA